MGEAQRVAGLERSPYLMDQTDLVGQLSCGTVRVARHSRQVVLVGPARVLYATDLPDVGRVALEAEPERLRAVADALMVTITAENARRFPTLSDSPAHHEAGATERATGVCAGCGCDGDDFGSGNAEAFDLTGEPYCDDCAEQIIEDNDQFGVGA